MKEEPERARIERADICTLTTLADQQQHQLQQRTGEAKSVKKKGPRLSLLLLGGRMGGVVVVWQAGVRLRESWTGRQV